MNDNFTDTELANEQWRDVEGYDGMYQVSDLGRVRSLKYGKVRVLRQRKSGGGYLKVCLYKDGKINQIYVHRLVAQAFIENTDSSKTLINHINEKKSDNRVSNLEWCDYRYNLTYNNIHNRRWINRNDYKRDKIKDLYNQDLTIDENLLIFKENGIECCRGTVGNLRKDLGLSRQRKYTKRS